MLRKGLGNFSGAEPDSTSPYKATPTYQAPPPVHKPRPVTEPPPPGTPRPLSVASSGGARELGQPAKGAIGAGRAAEEAGRWAGAGRGGRKER